MLLKNKSIKQLKAEADKVCSLYVRFRDKHCVSCGAVKDSKELQCGHYISRGKMNTRYLEENVNAQCYSCNIMRMGNYPNYTIYLEKKYGHGIIQKLKKQGDALKQWKKHELIEIIENYREKTKALLQ